LKWYGKKRNEVRDFLHYLGFQHSKAWTHESNQPFKDLDWRICEIMKVWGYGVLRDRGKRREIGIS
jgi:hypothetical protein